MAYSNKHNVKCDDDIFPGRWYRMTGNSGDQIPEECVPMDHCGTHAPGWLNGKHPTVLEGEVTRKVCYHSLHRCCKWKNYIRIRNCGGYYVYRLRQPPWCSMRYCGNKKGELNEYMTIAVESQFKPLRSSPKKVFRVVNGIRTGGLCVRAAVLYQPSYEDPYTGGWPIC